MIAHRVKIAPGKTFRFPLGITKPFNSDFDGDEMNIHVPLTVEARAELEVLSSVEGNFFSSQSSTTFPSIVQDGLLGTYIMTKGWLKLPQHIFFHLINTLASFDWSFQNRLKQIEYIYEKYIPDYTNRRDKYFMTGKTIFSLMLPDDFCYEKLMGSEYEEPRVIIKNGVLIAGTISKAQLGGGHGSLLFLIGKEYNPKRSMVFMDDIQFVANAFLLWHGFSVGLNDCLVRHDVEDVNKVIRAGYAESDEIARHVQNEDICEARISAALSKTKEIGLKISKDVIVNTTNDPKSGPENNNFVHTIMSGSKGNYFNITQITSLLGQQNVRGTRIQPQLAYKRTLVHYPREESKMSVESKYESRGFVRSSFIHGLNPREFFFHAISGREGVIDTAMKTSQTGYGQRKIVKVAEDLCVRNDGTVRDVNNKIVQFAYGCDNLDGQKIIKVNGEIQSIDCQRIADRVNARYENASAL